MKRTRLENGPRGSWLAPFGAVLLAAATLLAAPSTAQEPAPGSPPARGRLTGKVELLDAGGARVAARDAVVWVPGIPAGADQRAAMASRAKRFAPRVVAVERGTTVVFPNDDRIYHNVFSTTEGQSFDLGLYRNGASRSHRFDTPGLVAVYCNIHPLMAGYVRVVDGAHALTAADGTFTIPGLPPGPHLVRVWHERGGETVSDAVVRAAGDSELNFLLDASQYRASAHKNKHGQDYPPAALDDDRY